MHRLSLSAVLGTAFLSTAGFALPAMAQSSQSAQSIINQLKPTGTVSAPPRGLPPLSPRGQKALAGQMKGMGMDE